MYRLRHSKSLGRLLQALLALAVSLAPVAANAMEKRSAGGAVEISRNLSASHCQGEHDKTSKPGKAMAKNCCAAMCLAIAVVAPAPAGLSHLVQVVASPPSATFVLGSPGELPTPPPRFP